MAGERYDTAGSSQISRGRGARAYAPSRERMSCLRTLFAPRWPMLRSLPSHLRRPKYD